MNKVTKAADLGATAPALIKRDPNAPAFFCTERDGLSLKAGTSFAGVTYDADCPVVMPDNGLDVGSDYAIIAPPVGGLRAVKLQAKPDDATVIGGFHYAPGGNAEARAGGDAVPAINPYSIWDRNFRPACPDPRGMALVTAGDKRFWCDIYLTVADHLTGTSRYGMTIADGDDPPQRAGGGRYDVFDYETACAVMAHHGKQLLSFEEFALAAIGVTERSAADRDPNKTGLDHARTSRFGLMQATGNLWVWGHDGDPDEPRASMFGGSWWNDRYAGSRYASVAYNWPDNSDVNLGARGRGDHLQLG